MVPLFCTTGPVPSAVALPSCTVPVKLIIVPPEYVLLPLSLIVPVPANVRADEEPPLIMPETVSLLVEKLAHCWLDPMMTADEIVVAPALGSALPAPFTVIPPVATVSVFAPPIPTGLVDSITSALIVVSAPSVVLA